MPITDYSKNYTQKHFTYILQLYVSGCILPITCCVILSLAVFGTSVCFKSFFIFCIHRFLSLFSTLFSGKWLCLPLFSSTFYAIILLYIGYIICYTPSIIILWFLIVPFLYFFFSVVITFICPCHFFICLFLECLC